MKKIFFSWKILAPLGLISLTAGAFFAPGSADEVGKTNNTALAVLFLAGIFLIFLSFVDLGIVKFTKKDNQ